MTPQQSARAKKALVVGAVLLVGFLGFDWLRWWVFETRINNVLQRMPVKPAASDLVAIRGRVLEQARSLWLSRGSIDVEVALEQHTSNGYAMKEDQLELYWFVRVKATQGRRSASWEERIDNKVAETDTEALEKAGITVKRRDPGTGG